MINNTGIAAVAGYVRAILELNHIRFTVRLSIRIGAVSRLDRRGGRTNGSIWLPKSSEAGISQFLGGHVIEPLHVLLVTPTFFPASSFGGPVIFNKALFDSLSKMNDLSVEVVTTRWGMGDTSRWERDEGSVGASKVRAFGFRLVRDFSRELLIHLPTAIRRADIVQIHSFFSATSLIALLMARWFGVPVVLVSHGQFQAYGLRRRKWFKRAWLALVRAVALADRVVVRAASHDELLGNQQALPKFAHVQIESSVAIPARLARRGSENRLLFLGRLDPVKQVEVLLDVMCLLPTDVVLDIYGRGDPAYEASLREKSKALGISRRVTFQGWLEEIEKAKAFALASVVVVPSKSESFGQVVAEALAHGIPVVASQGTPWAELESRGCGRWVGTDPAAIASGCLEALKLDPGTVRRQAPRWVREKFSNQAICARFVAVYKAILDRSGDEALSDGLARRPAKICIVSSCGGHLAEVRALAKAYAILPHLFVLNDRIPLPPELIGRTTFITHSERDFRFLVNLWEMFLVLWRERPDLLLSSGAGPIVPAAIIGRYLFDCRVIYIETMTRMRSPSLTGRIMYRLAHRFVYQWPGLAPYFPKGTLAEPLQ